MLKLIVAFGLGLAGTAQADTLLQQHEAVSVAIETELFRTSGQSPQDAARSAAWDAQRRTDSTCALQELESLRGRNTAEKYVDEMASAAQKARSAQTAGEVMGYIGSAHGRSKLDLDLLMKITTKCGLGL